MLHKGRQRNKQIGLTNKRKDSIVLEEKEVLIFKRLELGKGWSHIQSPSQKHDVEGGLNSACFPLAEQVSIMKVK